MKKELKLNVISWIIMIGLILISFIVAETKLNNLLLLISIITSFKFIAILFQFVEAKNAHIVWKIVGLTFIAVYLIGLIYFN